MKKFIHIYRYLNIDVVAGALSGLYFASRLLGITISGNVYLLLALAVYVIYLIDHLYDAMQSGKAETARNQFYRKNWKFFVISGIALIVTSIILIFRIPTAVRTTGLIISALCLVYFAGVFYAGHKKWFFKEILIALIYTLAIWSIPVMKADVYPLKFLLPVIIPYFLLVLVNVLIYSYFQYDEDRLAKKNSIVQLLNKKRSKNLILVLCASVIMLLIPANFFFEGIVSRGIVLLYFIMSLIMSWVIRDETVFARHEKYAYVTDAVFFLPFIAALFL